MTTAFRLRRRSEPATSPRAGLRAPGPPADPIIGHLRHIRGDRFRLFLDAMDRMETLTRLLEHDAQRLPELTATVKEEVVDLSYRAAARAIASVAPELADVDAIAIVTLGSLVGSASSTIASTAISPNAMRRLLVSIGTCRSDDDRRQSKIRLSTTAAS